MPFAQINIVMAMTLKDFHSVLEDISRPNRFLVEFHCPFFVEKDISFLIKSAQIPSRTIGEIEIKKLGKTFKIAGDVTYEDLTITFLSDYDWRARTFVETWMNQITDTEIEIPDVARGEVPNLSMTALDINSYLKGKITVKQLGTTDKDEVIAKYEFVDAWPKVMNEFELSVDSDNQASEFQVIFAFSEWWVKK